MMGDEGLAKTVGIIGGMGPLATVDVMQKIINHTPAKNEQEHLHLIVDNNPQIPDRQAAICGTGTDPSPYILCSAHLLQRAGAELLAIACNTAHAFLPVIQDEIDIPIFNMQTETAIHMETMKIQKAGLLAADGTLHMKLFHEPMDVRGMMMLEPDIAMQKIVMDGIHYIKKGDLGSGEKCFLKVAEFLVEKGAEVIIAGCTEVSLVLHSAEKLQIIDPADILAQSLVKAALEL